MAWGLKALGILFGVIALSIGAWPVAILALGYLAVAGRTKRGDPTVSRDDRFRRGRTELPWKRYVFGVFLLLSALLASKSGGFLSPLVLAGAGVLAVSWTKLGLTGYLRRVTPEADSILLRSTIFPFYWFTAAEVKLDGANPVRAVSALEGRLVLFAGRTPAVYLTVGTFAPNHTSANRRIQDRLRTVTSFLSSRGAFIMPLDSRAVAAKFSEELKEVHLDLGDLGAYSSLPFDVSILQAEKGRIVSSCAFRASGEGVAPSLPRPTRRPRREPLLWEFAKVIEEGHGWPGPDEYSSFLNALSLTKAETLPEVLSGGQPASDSTVFVSAAGGPKVELTRPQLRAVAALYR